MHFGVRNTSRARWLLHSPPQEGAEDAASLQFSSTPELRSAAAAALRRIQAEESEWAELWEEAGESDEVTRVLAEIGQHLS